MAARQESKTQRKLTGPGGPVSECPPDTVLLVQVPRAPYVPCMSPFVVKLETYLRLAKIPYVTDTSSYSTKSPKGKIPYIEYKGQTIGDSQICIEFLNKTFKKDLNKHLSPVDRAASDAIRIMIDEHLYWVLMYFRWVDDKDLLTVSSAFPFPKENLQKIAKSLTEMLHAQGTGRHSSEEVIHFFKEDLRILSDYLGSKTFLTGETPCEVDCAAFGLLAQVIWQNITPSVKDIMKGYPTLVSYTERMRDIAWPDWSECITHGNTREATK